MINALFSIGFRPFFILCALMAFINPILWTFGYAGYLEIESTFSTAQAWHGHEMLFGFTGALVCGFLLTASSNWTGKKPIQGNLLIVLSIAFIIERIIPFLGLPLIITIILMSIFQFTFLAYLIYMLAENKNQKIVTPIITIFSLSKLAYLTGDFYENDILFSFGRDYGVLSILVLIVVISGRIIPMFSSRHLGFRPEVPPLVTKMSIGSIILLFIPAEYSPAYLQLGLLTLAIVANSFRLYFWQPIKCLKFPLLNILHMGQLFIILGLGFKMAEIFNSEYGVTLVPLHSFTIGALGLFAIGMMVRVSKGHTGRQMTPSILDRIIFHGIFLSAIIRMVPAFTNGDYVVEILLTAVFLWSGSYLLFLASYSKILLTPRE